MPSVVPAKVSPIAVAASLVVAPDPAARSIEADDLSPRDESILGHPEGIALALTGPRSPGGSPAPQAPAAPRRRVPDGAITASPELEDDRAHGDAGERPDATQVSVVARSGAGADEFATSESVGNGGVTGESVSLAGGDRM